jgi:hypothetical protein
MNKDTIRTHDDQTWFDYRSFWFSPDNHAIHFGCWDETTHSHADSLATMNRVMRQRLAVRNGDYILDAVCERCLSIRPKLKRILSKGNFDPEKTVVCSSNDMPHVLRHKHIAASEGTSSV